MSVPAGQGAPEGGRGCPHSWVDDGSRSEPHPPSPAPDLSTGESQLKTNPGTDGSSCQTGTEHPHQRGGEPYSGYFRHQLYLQVERDLYSKFKLVLNEKKNKIRRLMDGHAPVEDSHTHGAAEEKGRTTKGPSLAAATPEKRQSGEFVVTHIENTVCLHTALLGEADEVVSPPTRRRKREATHRATADIPKPPSFPSPHTSAKNTTDPSSSTDGDDLLHLL